MTQVSRAGPALTALWMATAAVACGGGDVASRVGVRDSASVRIVTSSTAPAPERVEPSLGLEVGAVDEPGPVFYRVADVVALEDGRLVVANAGTREVWWLSPSGEVQRKVGGDGGGPGEFRYLSWIRLLPGDTVAAYDPRQRRLTRFTPDGDLIDSEPVTLPQFERPSGPALAMLTPGVMAMQGDGHLLASGWTPLTTEGSRGVRTVRVTPLRIDGAGGVDTLPDLRAMDWLEVPGAERPGVVAFTPRMKWAVGVAKTYFTEGRGYRVDEFDAAGRFVTSIREARPRRAVSTAMRELWAADRPPGEEHVFADSLPGYDALLVDAGGYLWARDFAAPGDPVHRWTTFDADGARRTVVEFPADFTLESVRGGQAYGVARDSLGVERVRAYALPGADA